MPILTRRSLLRGLFAAPAIVAVGNIMPVKMWKPALWPLTIDAHRALDEMYDPRMLAFARDALNTTIRASYTSGGNPSLVAYLQREIKRLECDRDALWRAVGLSYPLPTA
jgi:hypothetical protein